jgi:hypothetical protein
MMNRIQLAAKLYDCRDSMKSLFGDEFEAKTKPYRERLQAFSERRKIGILDAALIMAKDLAAAGHENAVLLLLAAAVELVEPSQA